jgi:aminoglycoside 6'-N-acetyltransferase I
MDVTIRPMRASDRAVWAEMRAALWPDEVARVHAEDIDRILAGDGAWGFAAQLPDGVLAGFAELAIRPYANGCETSPVPFLEGVWVSPQFRRQGIGRCLIEHIEAFVTARGFREIGSDSLLEDAPAHAAHRGWGFSETERVVYFRKDLTANR